MTHDTTPFRHGLCAPAKRPLPSLFAWLLCAPLCAQQLDLKPAPVPDPVKGWHDMSPLGDAELAMRRGPHAGHMDLPAGVGARLGHPLQGHDRVLFDEPGDGRIWAAGTTYKASFGAEGFVYVPFLGSDAPQNYPVRFVLRAVRIGGQALALHAAEPVRAGQRVSFARGVVRESYELAIDHVEQTFVVDSALPGDVELDIDVVTELAEDPATEGLQFGNTLGCVCYGAAHVVDGEALRPVPTTFADQTIRIRVPAAERGPGAVVIDPIINTTAFTATLSNDSGQPDIAYDATSDQYLLVWQHPFSAADIDVWSEFRTGDGSPVAGSLATIDFTSFSHSNPRVANLAAYDRFLVVSQRFDGTTWQIYGRLRLVGSAPHPIVFPISDPAIQGVCVNPDIGGDSGNGNKWFVVWERQLSATDFDIHARLVAADTSFGSPTIFIDNSAATIHSLPAVSQSNGNGMTGSPRWLVAYQFRFSATDEDIQGAAIDVNGGITTIGTIDASGLSDFVPSVSSPATDLGGSVPMFLVTYERQNPPEARARLLSPTFANLFVNQVTPVNLTASFGLGPFWVRVESDGCRFAVINGAATISVATLAYNGSALVMHEAPQALPGIPSYPRIASKRSGGGSHTDYGIAYVDLNWFPDRILISAYRGHAGGNDVTRRVMGCNGLLIDAAGRPFLGEGLTFSLSNVGFDIPGFAFGTPVPATTVFCAPCPLGVSLTGVILIVGSSLQVPIACNTALIGFTAGVQGFALGSGPCAASLRFSDTIDFTVR